MNVADMDSLTFEERGVFSAIRRWEKVGSVARDGLRAGIEQLRNEHKALGSLLKQMRTLTRGYEVRRRCVRLLPGHAGRTAGLLDCWTAGLPDCRTAGLPDCRSAGLPALERDTFEHIHKENNMLFPQVSKLLEGGST